MGILLLGVAYNDFQPVVDDQLLEGRFFWNLAAGTFGDHGECEISHLRQGP